MAVVRNINDAKRQIQQLVNNIQGLTRQISVVINATPEASKQELMGWTLNHMQNATYIPALSESSNVILPGTNNPALAELRRPQYSFNANAPEFVPPTSMGGKRRKSMKKMRGGDGEGQPPSGMPATEVITNNSLTVQPNMGTTIVPGNEEKLVGLNLMNKINNPNPDYTPPEETNHFEGGRRRKYRRTARKNRKSRRANRCMYRSMKR